MCEHNALVLSSVFALLIANVHNEECPGNTDAGAIMKKFVYMS